MEAVGEANFGRQKGTAEIDVSIIIPVYKVSEYIERCLKTVMNQTYGSIECIMVDDASPDDSIYICEELISEYSGSIRFKILHHEKNRGLSAARNTGTGAAMGDYIFFLDSDDELPGDAIEKLVSPVLKDETIEMVMGNHQRISDGDVNRSLLQPIKMQREQDLDSSDKIRHYFYSKRGYGNAWNRLIKREFITRNKLMFKEGLLWEDHLWSFFVMKHLHHLYIIPDTTYFYHMHPQSIVTSTSQEVRDRHFAVIYETISNNLTDGERGMEAKYHLPGFCSYYVRNHKDRKYKQSARLFKKALSEDGYRGCSMFLSCILLMANCALGRWAMQEAFNVRQWMRIRI